MEQVFAEEDIHHVLQQEASVHGDGVRQGWRLCQPSQEHGTLPHDIAR